MYVEKEERERGLGFRCNLLLMMLSRLVDGGCWLCMNGSESDGYESGGVVSTGETVLLVTTVWLTAAKVVVEWGQETVIPYRVMFPLFQGRQIDV